MAEAARKRATYQDVLDAPENMVAEVLAGELHLQARPRRRHVQAHSNLGSFLLGAFDAGSHGPGGWRILFEPELHLGADILVPDLAGWRDGRLVDDPEIDEPFITVVPDWVAEVLSPGTARIDRMKKVPIFAREGVGHVWLVDPSERTIEVLRHASGSYTLVGTFGGDEASEIEPFLGVPIPPRFLWGRSATR